MSNVSSALSADLSKLDMISAASTSPPAFMNDCSTTTSVSSLMSSCYSFQSSQSLDNNNVTTSTNKRRLQPRTNPNYINVDFINTKNGSLIKNTYIKLQYLNNNSSGSEAQGDAVAIIADKNQKLSDSFPSPLASVSMQSTSSRSSGKGSTVSQAVLLLISLLNNNYIKTPKKSSKKKSSDEALVAVTTAAAAATPAAAYLSQSSSMNTVCSFTNACLKNSKSLEAPHIDEGEQQQQQQQQACLSLDDSSSATLISETSMNNSDSCSHRANDSSFRNGGKKKLMMSFKSANDVTSSLKKNYSASLNKKNPEKNCSILSGSFNYLVY